MRNFPFFLTLLVAFFLVSCGGKEQSAGQDDAASAAESPAAGTAAEPALKVWTLQAYGEPDNLMTVPADMEVTLTMDLKENRISGKAACNNYTGNLDGTAVGTVVATKKACPPPAMDMETTYLKMLDMVTSSTMQGDKMIMTLDDGRQLVFGT